MSFLRVLKILPALLLISCASKPMNPWTVDSPPHALVPIADAGVTDRRGRFREIFCEVLESRGEEWPDYRPCEEALTRVANEPPGSGKAVHLGESRHNLLLLVVPGVGWECIEEWLKIDVSISDLLHSAGYRAELLQVDGLYSKGAPDILEAIVNYPELRERVVAVISAAGAIGGSPLANTADQKDLNLMLHFPGSTCSEGDGGALESLRPAARRAWLASNPLPPELVYYSLVTFPHPDRMSSVLNGSYRKLSKVDARNDSQVIYYDQMIPGSTLLGFVNADHWAIAVPISRSHTFMGSTFVDKNDYPREAIFEAILRFVEEDLVQSGRLEELEDTGSE
jgi:hypothetical protein